MAEQESLTDFANVPRPEMVRRIRRSFGITQAKLAAAMGTSVKAIQSYEQGWRNVPTRALIQLLVLLAIHRRRQIDPVPCWEIKKCPQRVRAGCPSYTIGDGQFCWFVCAGARRCAPDPKVADAADTADADDLLPCMGCEVIRRLLHTESPATGNREKSAPPPPRKG